MMVLEGQERCLSYLRGGGTMGGLEGERISHDFPGAFPRSSIIAIVREPAGRAMATTSLAWIRGAAQRLC